MGYDDYIQYTITRIYKNDNTDNEEELTMVSYDIILIPVLRIITRVEIRIGI